MFTRTTIAVFAAVFTLILLTQPAVAQGNGNGHKYGHGKPARISDLPPGQLRRNIQSLTGKARANALKRMQEFSFGDEDLEYLRVSKDGEFWYADTFLPEPPFAAETEPPVIGEAIAESEIFLLHSRPGSSNVLYLDFDGHTITGTAWNDDPNYGTGIDPHYGLPFDPSENDVTVIVDGVPQTTVNFTSDELNRIGEIWYRIAEDYAPYDIDVTTELPDVFTPTTGRVLFTHSDGADGVAMPSSGGGGVAWINVFGRSDYASRMSPALVYYNNLYTNLGGYPTLNAEAAAHEFGHNIGLGHDGVPGDAYYDGHGTGFVSWSSIMGDSYDSNVTQWSKGEYANADNPEDDLSIIAGDLGYVTDDHSNTSDGATPIVVQANGAVLVTNPEDDPHYMDMTNKGIINNRDDEDWFYIDVGDGDLALTATPAWHGYTRSSQRGANLDIELELLNAALARVDLGEPDDDTNAAVSATLSAGRYYLRVDGVGNDTNSDYTDYASIGQYFIEGTVVPAVQDSDPPTPDPMTWATVPESNGADSIHMMASTASDSSGVEYQFTCVEGGQTCPSSNWQDSPTYDPTGLDPDTYYSWYIVARDDFNNQTGSSSTEGARTDALVPPNGAPTELTATAASTTQIDLSWQDNSSNETSFEIQYSADGSNWQLLTNVPAETTTYQDTGLTSYSTWYYRVFAQNIGGYSAASNIAEATTLGECAQTLELIANQTKLFALPCDPGSRNSVEEIFSELAPETYGSNWVIYGPNGSSGNIMMLGLGSEMTSGKPYFINTSSNESVLITGSNNTAQDVSLSASPDGEWNVVAYQGSGSRPWEQVVPLSGGAVKNWNWADKYLNSTSQYQCDADPSNKFCNIYHAYYRWGTGSYETFSMDYPMTGTLNPFDVIWVRAYSTDAGIRIPQTLAAPASGSSSSQQPSVQEGSSNAVQKDKSKAWHVKLTVESGQFKDRTNFLGQHKKGEDTQDSLDLEEPAPLAWPYLTILFDNESFAPTDWGYTTDFRALSNKPQGEWQFFVKAAASLGQATIRWQGNSGVLANALLLDEQTGESISVSPGGSYSFEIDSSGVNRFRFIVE